MSLHTALTDADSSATPLFPLSLPRADAPRDCRVLGCPVLDASTPQAIEHLLSGAVRTAFFVNAHCLNIRAKNRAYAAALGRADAILPDGIGVDIAARMAGTRLTENLNGTDFCPALLHRAAQSGLSVFLFGARPGIAEAAADRLSLNIPGLRIAGTLDGYEGAAKAKAAIDRINRSGADILLVAMGVPQQELWIDTHLPDLSPRLVLGVGALFDFLAGSVPRAPKALRAARLEWVWRLAQEPRRMARRYLFGNPAFLVRAASHALRETGANGIAKRTMDITLSGMALIALAPLLLLVALAIRTESKGPALFRQSRVGQDGVLFTMYKFRSMHTDAEARLAAIRAQSDRDGICFKSRQDPRVTRVGRVLRRYSIDELPQILNVFLGHMSIVGPRPALPVEVAAYPKAARERLTVRPGITGLWQVSGRADIGFEKMVDMDLAYVRSRSVLLDLLLVALTVRAVVSGRGAY